MYSNHQTQAQSHCEAPLSRSYPALHGSPGCMFSLHAAAYEPKSSSMCIPGALGKWLVTISSSLICSNPAELISPPRDIYYLEHSIVTLLLGSTVLRSLFQKPAHTLVMRSTSPSALNRSLGCLWNKCPKTDHHWEFPGSLVVRTWHFQSSGPSSNPGRGTNTSQAPQHGQKSFLNKYSFKRPHITKQHG